MKITHIHVFMVGWMYYLAIPVVVAYLGIFDSLEFWSGYIDTSGSSRWALPLYVVLMPFVFFLGDRLSCLIKIGKQRVIRTRMMSWLLWPIYALLLILFSLTAKDMIFAGYLHGYDSAIMGPIATLQMVILFQYILNEASGFKVAARLNMVLLAICSVILLSMGGRLYVASSVAAVLFYYWNWRGKTANIWYLALLFSCFIVLFAAIGMLRMGLFEPVLLILYVFTESLFTSISAFSIMGSGEWVLLDVPSNFLVAFINIVPSWIWEGKASFISSLIVERFDIASPFGAKSIVASSVENFGFIGGLMFIALVGFVMGWSRKYARSPISIALYSYLIGLLLFVFFRDPFSIQVKLVLTGFLLVWLYRSASLLLTPTSKGMS